MAERHAPNRELADAQRLHQAGRLAEAQAACRSVLARDPDCLQAIQLLGLLSSELREFEAAEPLLRRCIAMCPAEARYHANVGSLLGMTGRPQEAIAAFREAVRLKPAMARRTAI